MVKQIQQMHDTAASNFSGILTDGGKVRGLSEVFFFVHEAGNGDILRNPVAQTRQKLKNI